MIRENIAKACARAGRSTDEVTLMAVTKTVPAELVNVAIDAGVRVLGENRVQEYLSKAPLYRPEAEVHFIGSLQTNKVRQIVGKVALIHSVDSLRLAEEISRRSERLGIKTGVLIEVNIGGEATKSGCTPQELPKLLEETAKLPGIEVRGLMTIPPPMTDEGAQEALFEKTRLLYEDSKRVCPMRVLSMGMSGDYEQAIAHGSTMVRIGSALFGPRVYPAPQT